MQIANNNHIEDYKATGGLVIPDFSGKMLELKYNARTKAELNNVLARTNIAGEVSKLKSDLKFAKASVRLFHRNFKPSLTEQIKIVDWQALAFDDITVQFLGSTADLETVYDYARTKHKKPISILCPVAMPEITLAEVLQTIMEKNPDSTKWKFGKIQKHLANYRAIATNMKATKKPYYLTGARLRYGGKGEGKDCDVSLLIQAAFGFNGSCLDYSPPPEKKGIRRFAPNMDSLNMALYEWEKVANSNHKANRLQNYKKMDEAKLMPSQITTKVRFAHLVAILIGIKP